MTLRNIFDNLEHSADKWEPYFQVYERHLKKYVGSPINFVEVGVQKGGSLEMWSKYFGPQANIIGIDIDQECSNLKYSQNNIQVVIGDQGVPSFWDSFLDYHEKIDVFLDDGGHYMDQQIITFEKIFPHLSIGGVYICEDCHTSYMPGNGGGLHRTGTFIEYIKDYVDVLHKNWHGDLDTKQERKNILGKGLSGIFFYDSMVVLEKFDHGVMKRVFPKNH